MGIDRPDPIVKNIQAPLETALIDEFLRTSGYDPSTVSSLPPAQRERLMKQASAYASGKLAELEERAQFLQELHDAYLGE